MPYGAQFDTEGKTLLAPIFDYGYHIIDVATGKILKEKEFEIGPKEVKDLTRVYGVGHGYGPDKYPLHNDQGRDHQNRHR